LDIEAKKNYVIAEGDIKKEEKKHMANPLVEKYRPETFDEIVGNQEIIEQLQIFAKRPKGAIPNILIVGPAGCGKTTAVRCFSNERKCPLWEYNASDDRGIDFIRKISRISRLIWESINYLNEADSLTKEAQNGLKSILEKKVNTIFILDGNDEAGFIEPIKSRCVVFRFKPLTTKEIFDRLSYIIKAEGIQVDEQVEKLIREIAEQANGDLRRAINDLEMHLND
jgi:replication factor C small subunit